MKQQQHYKTVVLLTCTMALLASAVNLSVIAAEVYSWTDENGNLHYGDRPPEGKNAQVISIREAPLLSPTESDPAAGDSQADAVSDAEIGDDSDGQEAGPTQSVADARREKIAKARKERREAQAEMDSICASHRQRLARVEPNRRVFIEDESGQTVRMDDDKRIALVEESRDFIAENCD